MFFQKGDYIYVRKRTRERHEQYFVRWIFSHQSDDDYGCASADFSAAIYDCVMQNVFAQLQRQHFQSVANARISELVQYCCSAL
jgi:hypothetical protein